MDAFNDFIGSITAVIWADWVLYTVLAVGLLFTLWSGLCQYRALTHGVAVTRGDYDNPDDPGAINHFQALSAALSATVAARPRTGNGATTRRGAGDAQAVSSSQETADFRYAGDQRRLGPFGKTEGVARAGFERKRTGI